MADHDDDLVASKTEGFKVGEKKTIEEYAKLDQNDESLNRWKASLGLNSGTPIGKPGDPKCQIVSLALEVAGRPDVVIQFPKGAAVNNLESEPFTIKEGAKFRIKAVFQVHHEVLSGLKYLQRVYRAKIRVSTDQEMLGSYAPNTTDKVTYEKKFHMEEAPSGMMARGRYNAISKFVDDDDHTHLEFRWAFTIAKDW